MGTVGAASGSRKQYGKPGNDIKIVNNRKEKSDIGILARLPNDKEIILFNRTIGAARSSEDVQSVALPDIANSSVQFEIIADGDKVEQGIVGLNKGQLPSYRSLYADVRDSQDTKLWAVDK